MHMTCDSYEEIWLVKSHMTTIITTLGWSHMTWKVCYPSRARKRRKRPLCQCGHHGWHPSASRRIDWPVFLSLDSKIFHVPWWPGPTQNFFLESRVIFPNPFVIVQLLVKSSSTSLGSQTQDLFDVEGLNPGGQVWFTVKLTRITSPNAAQGPSPYNSSNTWWEAESTV